MPLTLLAAFCFLAPGDLLTPEERKSVEAFISAALAAGFPDGAKSAVHSGKLTVSATFDPEKEPAPLPSDTSTTQMTNSGSTKMTYGYAFQGLHFQLADGSWIISLAYRFKPRPGDNVDLSGAPPVDLAGLTEASAKAHPFHAEKDAAAWLDGSDPAHRARAAQSMDLLVPLTRYLKLNADALGPAILLLHRAGWPDAATASLSIADQRARNYWQLRPWTEPDPAFDPTGAYPKAKDEDQAWKKAHPLAVPEAPAVALRRALFRWCRGQIMADESFLRPEVATAVCKAAVDPKDPQGNAARTDALLAGSKLPVAPAAGADLVARLQSWEAVPRKPKMSVTSGNGGLSMSTGFSMPVPAYVPKKEDLDALVALLADERPSRFWDFNGPRSVGDNAWRAVAALVSSDPRKLAGAPTEKAWTAAERRSAAGAFQRWWKDHRKDYIEKK
jgi:hypothetical protein